MKQPELKQTFGKNKSKNPPRIQSNLDINDVMNHGQMYKKKSLQLSQSRGEDRSSLQSIEKMNKMEDE